MGVIDDDGPEPPKGIGEDEENGGGRFFDKQLTRESGQKVSYNARKWDR